MHNLAPSPGSARKRSCRECHRTKQNTPPDEEYEENQTHPKQSIVECDVCLHCAQCCYVMIDRKGSVQLTCETGSGPGGAKTTVAMLHYALVSRKQIRKRLHSRLRLSVLSSGQTAPRDG